MQVLEAKENGFKETPIGTIPNEWDQVRLGDIFDIQQGRAMSAERRSKNPKYPFLRTINVLWGKVDLTTLDQMYFSDEELEKLRLKKDDLLVCEGGEIGRTAIWKGEIDSCYHQNHVYRLRKKLGEIWPEFYMYWMQVAFLQLGLYAGEAIRTTIPNLSRGRLQTFIMPKPPFPEQQKIAIVLSKIQRAIEQQDKIIETTRNLKKSLMKKLFTEGIGHTEFKETEIGQIPKSWEVVKLGGKADFQYGHTASAISEAVGPKFLRITDIKDDGKISWEDVPYCKIEDEDYQKYKLHEGDILVARIGATTGKTCIIKNSPDAIFGSYLIRITINKKEILPEYVYFFTTTPIYWTQINANKEGKLKKGVSASFLKTLLIPITSTVEQQEIAHALRTIDNKIEAEQKRKSTLQQLFKTMLHKLMTGEIRVKDLDLEVQHVH